MRSAYNLSEEAWLAVINRPFMAGSFTWTGFDYKGEPNPYGSQYGDFRVMVTLNKYFTRE